jgi:hypothetical protein
MTLLTHLRNCVVIRQASTNIGLLYVITKYSQLFLCDLESATCLYSVVLTPSITFVSVLNSATQGLLAVNTSGEVGGKMYFKDLLTYFPSSHELGMQ